jgi:hypothetical protein
MDRTREKKMSKGVILFAFNSPKINYYDMAVSTAKRINHFLDLPVTIVTDVNSIPTSIDYSFDNTITTVADSSNKRITTFSPSKIGIVDTRKLNL